MKRSRIASALLALPLALAALTSVSCGQTPTCPGAGLDITGGRLGDAWSLALTGPPNASALLASDVAPGPIPTPFGTVCLGLTTALVTTPFSLDGSGTFSASGVLPLGGLFPIGVPQYVQAAFAHPSLPGGVALTNGAAVTIRPPRMFAFAPLSLNGNVAAIDGVTGSLVLNQTQSVAVGPIQPVRIPRKGWIGWKTTDGSLFCIDDTTGALVLTIPNVWSPSLTAFEASAVSDDGTRLFVTQHGVTTAIVKVYDLDSGLQLPVPPISAVNGLDNGIWPVPGTKLAYVGDLDRFHVVDGTTGTLVTTVMLPNSLTNGSGDQRRCVAIGTQLHVGTLGGLFSIDMVAHALSAGPSLVSQHLHSAGPGSAGTSLWCWGYGTMAVPNLLLEVSPATLGLVSSHPLPGQPRSMRSTAGGTELLIETFNPPSSPSPGPLTVAIHAVRPAPYNLSTVVASAMPGTLEVLRSGTLTKAFVELGPGALIPVSFPTDPCGGGGNVVALPGFNLTSLRFLSN